MLWHAGSISHVFRQHQSRVQMYHVFRQHQSRVQAASVTCSDVCTSDKPRKEPRERERERLTRPRHGAVYDILLTETRIDTEANVRVSIPNAEIFGKMTYNLSVWKHCGMTMIRTGVIVVRQMI